MKPLGKAMKIAFQSKADKKKALEEFLETYRATPHSATSIAPGDILLRHGYHSGMPRVKETGDKEVEAALEEDSIKRQDRCDKENQTRIRENPAIGDKVMVRNQAKASKFSPSFGPEWCKVVEVENTGVTCQGESGKLQRRHMDDVKMDKRQRQEAEESQEREEEQLEEQAPEVPRRSSRERVPNRKYMKDYVTEY